MPAVGAGTVLARLPDVAAAQTAMQAPRRLESGIARTAWSPM